MARLYRAGWTFAAIANRYGLTRQAVQARLKKIGVDKHLGGGAVLKKRRDADRARRREASCQRTYGCSVEQLETLRRVGVEMRKSGRRSPLAAYSAHRHAARKRRIGWKLTVWQWWSIWDQSGKWMQRGRGRGQYCMCRLGDVGPYSADNVFIGLATENSARPDSKRSGFPLGVHAMRGRFFAEYYDAGRRHRVGPFDTADAAHSAYVRHVSDLATRRGRS